MRIQSWTSVAVAALGSLLLSACGDDRSTKTDISSQPTAENNPAIEFILTLPEPLSEDTQFSYQTVDGTAKAGEDYQETSEGVVVAQGATS